MSLMSLRNAHKQGVCDISDINDIKKNFFVCSELNKLKAFL